MITPKKITRTPEREKNFQLNKVSLDNHMKHCLYLRTMRNTKNTRNTESERKIQIKKISLDNHMKMYLYLGIMKIQITKTETKKMTDTTTQNIYETSDETKEVYTATTPRNESDRVLATEVPEENLRGLTLLMAQGFRR